VIVREGEAQIAPQGSTKSKREKWPPCVAIQNLLNTRFLPPDRDSWDRWNSERDHLIQNADSYRHLNRRYNGSQDLDAYGRWQNMPDYGDVWVPNEPDGWVPYRDGNWTTSLPTAGPGSATSLGMGAVSLRSLVPNGNSWAWWPGPTYAGYNPFWAPAYVSFFGWGGGFGFGVGYGGWGGFGWLPIGPCDYTTRGGVGIAINSGS